LHGLDETECADTLCIFAAVHQHQIVTQGLQPTFGCTTMIAALTLFIDFKVTNNERELHGYDNSMGDPAVL
jgi:hypothetical protein